MEQLQHSWVTTSAHATSEGLLVYQRCHCGRWQVVVGARTVAGAG